MRAKVWKRDDAGGKTSFVGGKTPAHPVVAPGKRKHVWSRDAQPAVATTADPPNPSAAPCSSPAPAAISDAHPAKRRRSATYCAPAVATSTRTRAQNRSSGCTRPQTESSFTPQTKTPVASPAEGTPEERGERPREPGIGLARKLQRKQSEMEQLKQNVYDKQRKLHAEQVYTP